MFDSYTHSRPICQAHTHTHTEFNHAAALKAAERPCERLCSLAALICVLILFCFNFSDAVTETFHPGFKWK